MNDAVSKALMHLQRRNHSKAVQASWGIAVVAILLLVAASCTSKNSWVRSSLLGIGFLTTIIAVPIREIVISTEQVEDAISDLAYTQLLNSMWQELDSTPPRNLPPSDPDFNGHWY